MNVEMKERSLTTADLAPAAEVPKAQREVGPDLEVPSIANKTTELKQEGEQLAALAPEYGNHQT